GDFFKRDGVKTSFSTGGDGAEGKFSAGTLRNQATGASGQGTLLTMRFRALAAGAGQVRISGAQPIALDAPAVQPSLPAPWTLQVR
ncbi:MAG TPA: hypothetical protein VFP68_19035, partial [Burkholderiaceae bacterium]|nr:hypothetical protein [Burkholderiaceae bacterium]